MISDEFCQMIKCIFIIYEPVWLMSKIATLNFWQIVAATESVAGKNEATLWQTLARK